MRSLISSETELLCQSKGGEVEYPQGADAEPVFLGEAEGLDRRALRRQVKKQPEASG